MDPPELENGITRAKVFEEAVSAIKQHSISQLEDVLTKRGAHAIGFMDCEGRSLLHWAVTSGNEDVLKVLLEHINLHYHGSQRSPQATRAHEEDEARQLVLSPDAISNLSPLAIAISAGAAMKVYLLVKQVPAAITWTAHDDGICAIVIASEMLKSPRMVAGSEVLNAMLVGVIESRNSMAASFAKRLLSSGAAVDTWTPSGLSALMAASSTNQIEVMALLITGCKGHSGHPSSHRLCGTGADLELADAQGRTALMHAALNDCVDAVGLLLTHGAQADVKDFTGKSAVDLCVSGSDTAQLLRSHLCGVLGDAHDMACQLLEDVEIDPTSDENCTQKERVLEDKLQKQKDSLLPDDCGRRTAEEHTDEIAAFEDSCKGREHMKIAEMRRTKRTTCTIGADPVRMENFDCPPLTDALGPPSEDAGTRHSTGHGTVGAGPWHVTETLPARQRHQREAKSQGHLSLSRQSTESMAAEPQEEASAESAMSTFKQHFDVRDCSAATQGPSSRTPDPSFTGCRSDRHGVEPGGQPMNADDVGDRIVSVPEDASYSPNPFPTGEASSIIGKDWNICNTSTYKSHSFAKHTATAPQHLGPPSFSLVTDLAAQVISLQKKIDTMEIQHEIDTHEAVLETVQQMEVRLIRGCANLAAQLTWNELHRTGLAALYCGVNQGIVQPDALQAVTHQCLAGTARHSAFPCMHQGPAPPPPPTKPPPSQQCNAPMARPSPPLRMPPSPLTPLSVPSSPGPPPLSPPVARAGAPIRVFDAPSPKRSPTSPLSQSHHPPNGAFSALAKPFSPLACEWNCPNNIWAPSDPAAARHLPGRGSAMEDGVGTSVPKSSTGAPRIPSVLNLPDSLPGSNADPADGEHDGEL